MEKTSHSVKHNPSLKEVRKQPFFDLNQLPSMDDVPPPPPPTLPPPPQPHIREGMTKSKRKYKVMNPPSMIRPDYYKNLGFVNGYDTLMFVSDKKAKLSGRSLHVLARSWFKEGVRKQDKRVSEDLHEVSEDLHEETCHRTDVAEVEKYLKKPGDESEVANILIVLSAGETKTVEEKVLSTPSSEGMVTRSKAKTVEKRVLFTSAPCTKKRKYAPKMRRLNDIPREGDQN